jgi:hypothetical protein
MNGMNIHQPSEQPVGQAGERCRSLRCNGMYLQGSLGSADHISGDGNFWCNKTQRNFGPDDQFVGDGECRHSRRSCYESNG